MLQKNEETQFTNWFINILTNIHLGLDLLIYNKQLFLYAHRETSALANELPEESDQFRFLRAACLPNIKGSLGLILAKVSDMRISIPFDLLSRSFIPLPCFIRSRPSTPLLAPSLVFSPRRSA